MSETLWVPYIHFLSKIFYVKNELKAFLFSFDGMLSGGMEREHWCEMSSAFIQIITSC